MMTSRGRPVSREPGHGWWRTRVTNRRGIPDGIRASPGTDARLCASKDLSACRLRRERVKMRPVEFPETHTPRPQTATASSPNPSSSRPGRIDRTTARLARVGADPRDDEELRQKKKLLVLIAVLILPVSLVWGGLYLAFGSWVGIVPYIYFAVSLGSLVIFARTRNFQLLLVTQLLNILITTTVGMISSSTRSMPISLA